MSGLFSFLQHPSADALVASVLGLGSLLLAELFPRRFHGSLLSRDSLVDRGSFWFTAKILDLFHFESLRVGYHGSLQLGGRDGDVHLSGVEAKVEC